jgi:coenzyme Q-binding protein COQ10
VPFVETITEINGDVDQIFALCMDMESFPQFMDDLESVKVIERGSDWTITEWKTKLQGRPLRWLERDEFDPGAKRITYAMTEGDLAKFEGEWTITPVGSGARVRLTVDFELGIPMFASLLNPVATMMIRRNCEQMLAAIKRRVEGE